MELMRVVVEKVSRSGPGSCCVAEVWAVSRERVGTKPRAGNRMTLQLDEIPERISLRNLKSRARDEALAFLDIA